MEPWAVGVVCHLLGADGQEGRGIGCGVRVMRKGDSAAPSRDLGEVTALPRLNGRRNWVSLMGEKSKAWTLGLCPRGTWDGPHVFRWNQPTFQIRDEHTGLGKPWG